MREPTRHRDAPANAGYHNREFTFFVEVPRLALHYLPDLDVASVPDTIPSTLILSIYRNSVHALHRKLY